MRAVAGVLLRTSRFDAMTAFYRDRLGLPVEVRTEDGIRHAEVDLGDVRFGIVSATEDLGARRGVALLLRVDDAAAEHRRLRAVGLEFLHGPQLQAWGGLVAALRDPDHNEVQLVSWTTATARAATEDGDELQAWLEAPEPGWSDVISPQSLAAATFLSGGAEGERLRIRYFKRETDGAMMGKVWFGPQTQGPPGHAHGGSMASLLDEAMGGAAWTNGHSVLAAELTTRFRRMLPLETRCIVEARVVGADGRKVYTEAELRSIDGEHFADGKALFIEIDPKRFAVLLDRAGTLFKQILDET